MNWKLSGRVALAVLASILAGCDRGSSTPGSSAALADTLPAIIAAAYDFARPGALERMNRLYASSDSVVSASGGRITVSADSVRAGISRFWELAGRNMRDARWQWEEVHVEALGNDAAVLTGSWLIPHIALDGHPHVIEGVWTAVFRRIDGEWRIVHEHLSVPTP